MLSKICEVAGVPIHSYGLMIMIGFLCGLFVASRRAKVMGLPPGLMTDLGVYAIIAGMLGAKTFFLIENHEKFGWALFNLFDGGLSVRGAAIGAAVGAVLFIIFLSGTGGRAPLGDRRKRRKRLIATLLIFLAFAALVGARADFVRGARQPDPLTGQAVARYDTVIFDQFGSGFVFYGGILPAAIAIWIVLAVRKVPKLVVFDVIAPSLMIGLAFGRIGCHLNGCCFGEVCPPQSPMHAMAVTFPKFVDAPKGRPQEGRMLSPAYEEQYGKGDEAQAMRHLATRSQPVFPSQLMASADAFIIFWILTWFAIKPRRAGSSVLLVGILYPLARFGEEMLRGDRVFTWQGLRVSQWISLGIVAIMVAAAILWWRSARSAGRSAAADATRPGRPSTPAES